MNDPPASPIHEKKTMTKNPGANGSTSSVVRVLTSQTEMAAKAHDVEHVGVHNRDVEADMRLESLGYAQELKREISMIELFGFSFSIMGEQRQPASFPAAYRPFCLQASSHRSPRPSFTASRTAVRSP